MKLLLVVLTIALASAFRSKVQLFPDQTENCASLSIPSVDSTENSAVDNLELQ